MPAQAAMGTKLQIGANSIVDLTSIGGMELAADTIETTTLDSNGWRTFIGGLKDAGEVSAEGFFNPSDTLGQKALYDAYTAGTVLSMTILFPFGASWGFSGIVTAVKTGASMEDAVPFDVTIKVSGAPTLGITSSFNLSAFAAAGATTGTISPAFLGNTYLYSLQFTGATATVTATLATATSLALYRDGVFVQNLTTGVASGAMAFNVGQTSSLQVVVQEAAKAPKYYEVTAVRTA